MSPLRSPSIWAAGGVMRRSRRDGKVEYLVIYRDHYDDWTLPKGKLDRGETFKQAALREVEEETGFRGRVIGKIGSIGYETPGGNSKVVRYWLLEAGKGQFQQNREVAAIEWLTARKARARLTYERDRAVLSRGVDMVKRRDSGRIYLTRHALAGDRNQWKGVNRRRPLSKRGAKQAEALADFFTHLPVERIYSSPFDRCKQTVEPIGRRLGIGLRLHKALTEGTRPRKFNALIRRVASTTAVLSTQGDVIGAYVERLAHKGVKIDGPLKWQKGSIWVLETRGGKVHQARYVPPPI